MVAWGAIATATIKGTARALSKGTDTAKSAAQNTAERTVQTTAENIGASVAADSIGAVCAIVLGGIVIMSQVGIGTIHAGNTVRGWFKNPLAMLMGDSNTITTQSMSFAPLTIHTPFLIDETPPGSYDFTLANSSGSTSVSVPAPCEGVITDAGSWGGYGNGLDLRCSDGMIVRMTHFKSLAVSTGSQIALGQSLGIQGTTGNSTGDHVHLEITLPGKSNRSTNRNITRPIVEGFFTFWREGQSGKPNTNGDFYSRYKAAIAQQESGGDPTLVNRDSGALGLYQFMPATLAGLAPSCVGYQPSRSDFLSDRALQEKIMDCYIDSAKPRITAVDEYTRCRQHASHHYSGDPGKYANTARQTYGGNSYPSIANYTISVCGKI